MSHFLPGTDILEFYSSDQQLGPGGSSLVLYKLLILKDRSSNLTSCQKQGKGKFAFNVLVDSHHNFHVKMKFLGGQDDLVNKDACHLT